MGTKLTASHFLLPRNSMVETYSKSIAFLTIFPPSTYSVDSFINYSSDFRNRGKFVTASTNTNSSSQQSKHVGWYSLFPQAKKITADVLTVTIRTWAPNFEEFWASFCLSEPNIDAASLSAGAAGWPWLLCCWMADWPAKPRYRWPGISFALRGSRAGTKASYPDVVGP